VVRCDRVLGGHGRRPRRTGFGPFAGEAAGLNEVRASSVRDPASIYGRAAERSRHRSQPGDGRDVTRISLVFAPLRWSNGDAFSGGIGQFQIYWNTWDDDSPDNRDHWYARRAYQVGYVSSSQFSLAGWRVHYATGIDRPKRLFGIVAEPRWTAVSAMFLGANWYTGAVKPPFYFPTMSGTAHDYDGHVDTNDAAVMAGKLCMSPRLITMADDFDDLTNLDFEEAQCICDTQSPSCSSLVPIDGPREVSGPCAPSP
jgi:hypothetical protein